MTKRNPKNKNEIKSDIFHGTYPNQTSCHKILKYFNSFHNWHLLAQTKIKIKREMCKFESIFIQGSTLFKWLLKFIS